VATSKGLRPPAVGGFTPLEELLKYPRKLLADAVALQEAGCFSLVLEGIPAPVAERVTAALEIPTIGIGAGVGCAGQVLVLYDLLGLDERFAPKFVKKYDNLHRRVVDAVGLPDSEIEEAEWAGEEELARRELAFGLRCAPGCSSAFSAGSLVALEIHPDLSTSQATVAWSA
jgi:3-methyl-2-oxobutanoate hydroxymethyltransferase